jgi:cyanate lyase
MFRSSAAEAGARPLAHTRSPHEPRLIHEEFGDGIMSAIDFSMDITREPDPKGDRVNVVLSGKFLPYKTY